MRSKQKLKKHWTFKENYDLSKFYNADYYDGVTGTFTAYSGYTLEKLRKRFRYQIKIVRNFVTKGRLLDIGCAKGFFVKIALEAGYDAYGIDFSEYAIRKAKSIVGDRVQKIDIEKNYPYPNKSFNIITAWDLLEHLKDPEKFLKRASALLKPKGYLFMTTLNYSSLMSRLMPNNWRFLHPLHISYRITPQLLQRWLLNAEFKLFQMDTRLLSLTPLPKQLKIVQYGLSKIINFANPILAATNLGDIIECTAQK